MGALSQGTAMRPELKPLAPLPMKPDLPPPVFAPRVIAEAILHAAQTPVRDIFVGEPAVAGSSFAQFAPGITDLVLRRFAVELQQQNVPDQRPSNGNLFAPNKTASLRESSDRKGVTFQHSPYTEAMTHWTNPLDLLRRAMGGR
jgi:hypothetical protein